MNDARRFLLISVRACRDCLIACRHGRARVKISGRGASEMTVAELSRQIDVLRREHVGERVIERIEVEVV